MKKIGILGEHPQNDAQAIKNLIEKSEKVIGKKCQFKIAVKNIRGSDFEKNGKPSKKAIKLLRQEYKSNKFSFVIYLRDLDGAISETEKIKKKDEWFNIFDGEAANGEGLFYLAIYETESIILADIDTFNKIYGTKISFSKNPMHQKDPKEFLKSKTYKNKKKQYRQSDCADIFSQLNLNTVLKNHKGKRSFAEFIEALESKLN